MRHLCDLEKVVSRITLLAFMSSGAGVARADFSGDFAPINLNYYETDTSSHGSMSSLNSTTMQITSADWPSGGVPVSNTYGQYSIAIPWCLESIKFDNSYVTNDRDSSYYDMSSYTLNGNQTLLAANNLPIGGTFFGSISLDVSAPAGKALTFTQSSNDCVLGTGVLSISKLTAKSRGTLLNSNDISTETSPLLSKDNKGFTCNAGSYVLRRYGFSHEKGMPTSFVYTLIVDGKRVSTISSDNWKTLSRSLFQISSDLVPGIVSASSASWSYNPAVMNDSQCEVVAFQDSTTSLSTSNIIRN